MTLNDLIRKAVYLSNQLSSGDVLLTFPRERLTLDEIEDIDLTYHEDGPYIEVKLSRKGIISDYLLFDP